MFVNLAAVVTALMIAEVYIAHIQKDSTVPVQLDQVHVTNPHPVLGYVAPSDTRRTVRKTNSQTGQVIYEHTVTIGENGLRTTLPFNSQAKDAILFFGDSFAYGEGVGDDETLPAQVAIQTGGNYRVYNFGLHGYGPQHMLAAVEHNLVNPIVQPTVRFVFYVTIKDHVRRLAGNAPYLRYGPRYVLSDEGEAVSAGSFNRPGSVWGAVGAEIKTQLMKSAFLMRVWFSRVDESEVRLYIAAVKKAAKLFSEAYPDAEFRVLFWDIRADKDEVSIADRLRQEGIAVYGITPAEFPGFLVHPDKYQIAGDGHPTAYMYHLVAQEIVRQFIESRK
ncbi:MAG: hypothetical protein K2Y51_13460 [Gammaproteobacteria bacterium]|nr:hypothetical protein [Gammaproteobacteria bacterium]